ncbi:MAG: iron chelate uptake ABC transporter family permease subunit, partial [Chloroflexota bacterium]
ADPYVLGTASGAALGAAIAVILPVRAVVLEFGLLHGLAFLGALGAVFVVYRLSRVGGGLGVNQVTPGPNLPGIRGFYQHPVAMVGTDSTFVGLKPSPRSYGSYPRILGQFVRDEGLFSLETAVAKMTSMPAARLGLKDRGRIADGLVADLVIFDPATVRSNATYEEPRRFPTGIETVIVDGVPVVDGGEATGALPGRALRRGRD